MRRVDRSFHRQTPVRLRPLRAACARLYARGRAVARHGLTLNLLSLAVAALVAVWLLQRGGLDGRPAPTPAAVLRDVDVSSGPPTTEPHVSAPPRSTGSLIIHLVSSEEAGATLRAQLHQAERDFGAANVGFGPPPKLLVLVAGSPEAEFMMSLPLPPGTRIHDLRDGRAPAPLSLPAVRTATMSKTIYIVGSEDQASMVRAGMEEANHHRHEFGLAPLLYDLIVDEDGSADLAAWPHRDGALGHPDRTSPV